LDVSAAAFVLFAVWIGKEEVSRREANSYLGM